ncbi:RHS repeat-associated core domain-containing protein [Wenjunlia vitaminophila]|uniref:RHS repeat-associated core domain-containing protein n=1 Tax=Wenjunlia vitaminophila TaxID=76728 RepID=UPI001F2B2389|nr:RHS repeat-associated core domain-containing protein [Wenjunlia vitaminophila]
MWGTTTWNRNATAHTPSASPGQYHDPETGLHYNHHRYLQPTTAHYLTPRPPSALPRTQPHTYPHKPQHPDRPPGSPPYLPRTSTPHDYGDTRPHRKGSIVSQHPDEADEALEGRHTGSW